MTRFVSQNASRNHPRSNPFIEKLVQALKESAHASLALHGKRVDFQSLQFEVRQEVGLLRMLDHNIAELEKQIEILYQRRRPSDGLRSIPGIGPTLAPLLVGVLAQAERFRNERHVRGFCGLFPTKSSSGGIDRPGQRITKSGNDRIKRALYVAADTARKIDPDLAAVYWRLMVKKGHHHKQALCAVATRLVNRIFLVLKTGKTYVLRDCDGKPITVADGKRIVAELFTVPADIRRARARHIEAAA